MLHGQHIISSFDKDLSNLNSNLIKVTQLLIEQLHTTISLLKDPKQESLLETIAENEKQINTLTQNTVDLCLAIFTLRSPVASDLRYVFAASNLGKILEQNGDSLKHAINKEIVNLVTPEPDLDEEVISMLEHLVNLHNKALNALIKKDLAIAELSSLNDRKVQEGFSKLCNLLLQKIQVEPSKLSSFYDYIFLGKRLESMAGRVNNIRKLITFIEDGKL